MPLAVRTVSLALAETFTIARSSVDFEEVVQLEFEHDGVVGRGEGAPVDYWGETTAGMASFLEAEGAALIGVDPFNLEAIGRRCAASDAPQGALMALDAAVHDWIGRRLGQPTWRLLGIDPATMPPTSYTIGIDTVEGTADRTRRAWAFEVLKVKVGGADDLARLEAVRAAFKGPIRIDGNEGWTIETARELTPHLRRLGVEFVEQPFEAADTDAYLAYRELAGRLPVVLDESCKDLQSVEGCGELGDGINIKLSKCGGIREAIRMIHAARALGLKVMLGCMIESELGIAAAAQVAPLVDFVDLDGHVLIKDGPFRGLGFADGRVVLSDAPGLGVEEVPA